MELSREAGTSWTCARPLTFDCLDRNKLLQKLRPLVSFEAEYVCWQGLLANVEGILQTPWGCSLLRMARGIKHGAPESPALFAEAESEFSWALFLIYMTIWMMARYGLPRLLFYDKFNSLGLCCSALRLNLAKCQLHCSPTCPGPHAMELQAAKLEGAECLEVMVFKLRVGMMVDELVLLWQHGPVRSSVDSAS